MQASEIQMNSWRNVCYEVPVCVYVNVYIVWFISPRSELICAFDHAVTNTCHESAHTFVMYK